MSDTKNVTYGKPKVGGALSVAPLTAALPKDAVTALGPEYKALGYISEDGLTNENSPESENIKAWGGDIVLTTQTEKSDTFSFILIEALNLYVLKFMYGEENVTGTLEEGVKILSTSQPLSPHILVFDLVLQNALKRIVIPHGTITEIGEINYVDDGAVGYETTVQALPVEGATHMEFLKKVEESKEVEG